MTHRNRHRTFVAVSRGLRCRSTGVRAPEWPTCSIVWRLHHPPTARGDQTDSAEYEQHTAGFGVTMRLSKSKSALRPPVRPRIRRGSPRLWPHTFIFAKERRARYAFTKWIPCSALIWMIRGMSGGPGFANSSAQRSKKTSNPAGRVLMSNFPGVSPTFLNVCTEFFGM